LEVPMILFEDIDCQRLLYLLIVYLLFEVASYGWFYLGPIVIILGNACYNGEVSWNASYDWFFFGWWAILKCKLLWLFILELWCFKKNRLLVELCMFFVKRMKEQNMCCCIYHVEIDELAMLYTTCIPNLGFILAHVTSLVKKIVNLQLKSPLNVLVPWPHTQF